MAPVITIALATYRGARFLRAQLDSLVAQDYPSWRLLVSDDGSDDGTCEILRAFASTQPANRVRLIQGPGKGATRNFLHLTGQIGTDGWFAYCDQDDVWNPDKLSRAAAFLTRQAGPAVYAARTTLCNEDLTIIGPAPAFTRPLGFRNALIQACLPGNTLVGNGQALGLLQQGTASAQSADIISHDWWAYQVLSGAGAAMIRDQAQVLLYRQHPKNVMGRNDTTRARAARLGMLRDGTFATWLFRNQAALEPISHLFSEENRLVLRSFGRALQQPGPRTLGAFLGLGLYRQSRSGTAAVFAAALAGRLRSRADGTPGD